MLSTCVYYNSHTNIKKVRKWHVVDGKMLLKSIKKYRGDKLIFEKEFYSNGKKMYKTYAGNGISTTTFYSPLGPKLVTITGRNEKVTSLLPDFETELTSKDIIKRGDFVNRLEFILNNY